MSSMRGGYNKVSEDWHKMRQEGRCFHNDYLEMPTTLKLLGNIKGKKILDLGCGTGIYAKILYRKGAIVQGVDISEKEIEIAIKENPKIEFKLGNSEKLPYSNREFDIVLAALVLEHLKNWSKTLKEVRRVLKKNGLFIFSMGNPVVNCIKQKGKSLKIIKNYFEDYNRSSDWGNNVCIKWYSKTYRQIIGLLVRAGFEIVDYEDCRPIQKAKKIFPKEYAFTSMLPYFCTWKWRKK